MHKHTYSSSQVTTGPNIEYTRIGKDKTFKGINAHKRESRTPEIFKISALWIV